jgi:hypothetical protein
MQSRTATLNSAETLLFVSVRPLHTNMLTLHCHYDILPARVFRNVAQCKGNYAFSRLGGCIQTTSTSIVQLILPARVLDVHARKFPRI